MGTTSTTVPATRPFRTADEAEQEAEQEAEMIGGHSLTASAHTSTEYVVAFSRSGGE